MQKSLNRSTQIRIPNEIYRLTLKEKKSDVLGMYIELYTHTSMLGHVVCLDDADLSILSQIKFTKENIRRFRKAMSYPLKVLKDAGYIEDYLFPKQTATIGLSPFALFGIDKEISPTEYRILSLFDYNIIKEKIYSFEENTQNTRGIYKVSAWDALLVFMYIKEQMFQWHNSNTKSTWRNSPLTAKISYEDMFSELPFSANKTKLIFQLLQRLDLIEYSKPIKYMTSNGKARYGRTVVVEKTPISERSFTWQEEFRNGINEYSNFLRNKGLFVPAYNHGLTASNSEERELY